MKKGFDFQVQASQDACLEFEYDPEKSHINRVKHGIDFDEAQLIWSGPMLVTPSAFADEVRLVVIGRIKNKNWSAVITKRNEKIRIISVRRSREAERRIWRDYYESGW